MFYDIYLWYGKKKTTFRINKAIVHNIYIYNFTYLRNNIDAASAVMLTLKFIIVNLIKEKYIIFIRCIASGA